MVSIAFNDIVHYSALPTKKDWSFEAAMSVSILATVFVYVVAAYLAVNHGNVIA